MQGITPSDTPLVDIGANLTHESFASDLKQVVERATSVNVQKMIITGSDLSNSAEALELVHQYPHLFACTAGIHPHYAEQFNDQSGATLNELCSQPQVKAVGETGLDFFRDISPRETQQKSFAAHMELAAQLEMPMFLHQRQAHQTFLAMLRDYRNGLGSVVVHCFTDTAEALDDYIDLDCHIGITGWICDERRGAHLLDCVASIPLDRLLIETDAPYLIPRTLRPKPKTRRNEPCTLPMVLETIARARPEPAEQIAEATTANAHQFFNLEKL